MKNLVIFVISVLLFCAITASAEPWELSLDANLNYSLTNYSDSWTGGEAGAMNWVFNSNFLAQKQLHAKVHNKNTLKMSFGQTYSQVLETKEWLAPVKSTDLIDFETIFSFTLGAFVDPFAAGRLETQFQDASVVTNKRLFNPMKFTESAGVIREIIKEEKREWTARLGAAFRQNMNRDVIISIEPEEKETQTTNDGGLEFVTELRTPLANNKITYNTKLQVYKAFFYSESGELEGLPNEDYWKSPDINWEHIFTAGITEYLMVNLYIQMLYDKEVDLRGRFKQTLSLGLTYKLL
ncbi:DUF3078 domain-containing protein [bacterium]|nr:DUF3078 domain-containing protein [bacterium]